MSEQKCPIILIGGGGHASVIAEILLSQGRDIVSVISPNDIERRSIFKGITHFRKDDDVLAYDQNQVVLVNGIGMTPKSKLKKKVNEYFLKLGYRFETVIADNAYISLCATIEEGAQILPMAIVHTGARVGCHSVVNTGAIIEHDCHIGPYNHIAPRATLCGEVETGSSVFIGAGAVIIQKITILENSIIGAGTSIVKNVGSNKLCYSCRTEVRDY